MSHAAVIRRKGPSPEAIERINIALVVLLKAGPIRLSDWSHACKPYMTSNDMRSVQRRCIGANLTKLVDGRIVLTARGRGDAYRKRRILDGKDEWHQRLIDRGVLYEPARS